MKHTAGEATIFTVNAKKTTGTATLNVTYVEGGAIKLEDLTLQQILQLTSELVRVAGVLANNTKTGLQEGQS